MTTDSHVRAAVLSETATRGVVMGREYLDDALKESLRSKVETLCGRAAGPAVAEFFDDTEYHGKNYTCELVDENDHLVVVLDCECSLGQTNASQDVHSVTDELLKQGVILYYSHSIVESRHHICLAVKKTGATYPLEVHADRPPA